jgi:ferredoxin
MKQVTPGPLFVDDTCISCEACWKAAPQIFKSDALETFAYVFKQPDSSEEKQLCESLIKLCPVGAIRKDQPL